jgi:hypothetical protein
MRRTPRPGQTILAEMSGQTFGGKGANQAVVAASLWRRRGSSFLRSPVTGLIARPKEFVAYVLGWFGTA